MFATARRYRQNSLTNVVVRESMRAWSGNVSPIRVQVFDILNVIQASGRTNYPEPLCRFNRGSAQKTFQNVCSYYDVKIVARYKW
ncbi:MAG TPA: hypothetical protein VI259_18715 [Gemmatimonadaceae bacterium]